jgi:K+-transporting ATPase A subunit
VGGRQESFALSLMFAQLAIQRVVLMVVPSPQVLERRLSTTDVTRKLVVLLNIVIFVVVPTSL